MEQERRFNIDLLKCHICHLLPKDAVEMSCCGSLSCWECLMKRPIDTVCVACGSSSTDIESCQPSKIIQKLIDSMTYVCPSCKHVFTSENELNTHTPECPLLSVKCKFAHLGCNELLTKKQYEYHMRDSIEKHLELVADCLAENNNSRSQKSGEGYCVVERMCGQKTRKQLVFGGFLVLLLLLLVKALSMCQLFVFGVVTVLGLKLWRCLRNQCRKSSKRRRKQLQQLQQIHQRQHQQNNDSQLDKVITSSKI